MGGRRGWLMITRLGYIDHNLLTMPTNWSLDVAVVQEYKESFLSGARVPRRRFGNLLGSVFDRVALLAIGAKNVSTKKFVYTICVF